jgi:hypothetical protein
MASSVIWCLGLVDEAGPSIVPFSKKWHCNNENDEQQRLSLQDLGCAKAHAGHVPLELCDER